MICLSSAGSLASFDGGFRGARPHRERPRAGAGGPRSRKRGGTAHAVGSRGRTGHASAGGLVVDLALRRGRGLDAAAALARQPWAGARGSRGSPARPPAPETRERSSLAPRRMEAPLEETCVRAEPGCAICVQRFDDSLNSAIRTTYRISLRSSSLREPRYPSAGVVGFHKLRQRRRESPRCAREGAVGRGDTRARPRRTRALRTHPGARQEGCGPGSAQESPPDSRARRANAEPAAGLDGVRCNIGVGWKDR